VTRDQVVTFLRKHKVAVVATVAPDGQPQAAVVGIATSDELEIIFDTVEASRKFQNLSFEPRVAVVVGWDAFVTVQIDGDADFPVREELERIRACYFATYPDGRARLSWPGITHTRVRPRWLRYSDFTHDRPLIVEMYVTNGELVVKR